MAGLFREWNMKQYSHDNMKRHGLLLIVYIWSVCNVAVMAQQEPAFVHYFEQPTQYNPAAVGKSPQLQIHAAFQSHASGFEDAGNTMFASANMAFQLGRTRHGLGVVFQNDLIGIFSQKRISFQYAYHLKLLGGVLSLGGQADMLNESVDGSKADMIDSSDPAIPSGEVNGSKIDASAGVFYQHGPWYVGLSSLHLMAPTILLGERNEMSVKRQYYFTAGYNIKTKSPFFKIEPSVFLHYDGVDYRARASAIVRYEHENRRLYIGASYSPEHSVALLVGGMFHGVNLSYSYEAFTSGMGLDAGQHEVTIGYSMDLDFSKRGRNYHKSVRWL